MSNVIIDLKNIDITFTQKRRTIQAVKDVSIQIEKGDIYGIVGYSGAGKSTLVRAINLLQVPTAGKITIGKDVTFADGKVQLSTKELRQKRQTIGMIFQHFNLMAQKTAYENVAFALRHSKLSNEEKDKKFVVFWNWLIWLIVRKTTLHNCQVVKNNVWRLPVPWLMILKS